MKTKFISFLFILLLPISVQASSPTGKVGQLLVHKDNIIFFSIIGTPNACATTGLPPGDFSVSLSSKGGQAIYSMLLTAKTLGQVVSVNAGNCLASHRKIVNYIWRN